jgi:hypothetical protein
MPYYVGNEGSSKPPINSTVEVIEVIVERSPQGEIEDMQIVTEVIHVVAGTPFHCYEGGGLSSCGAPVIEDASWLWCPVDPAVDGHKSHGRSACGKCDKIHPRESSGEGTEHWERYHTDAL